VQRKEREKYISLITLLWRLASCFRQAPAETPYALSDTATLCWFDPRNAEAKVQPDMTIRRNKSNKTRGCGALLVRYIVGTQTNLK